GVRSARPLTAYPLGAPSERAASRSSAIPTARESVTKTSARRHDFAPCRDDTVPIAEDAAESAAKKAAPPDAKERTMGRTSDRSCRSDSLQGSSFETKDG